MTKLKSIPLILPIVLILLATKGCSSGDPPPGFGVHEGQPYFGQQVGPRWEGHTIVRSLGADRATFAIVAPPANATPDAWTYARDATQVFIGADAPFALTNCDPKTFVILDRDGKYSRDAEHVYYCGIQLKDADPKTFQVLAPPYSKDSQHAYAGAAPIDVLDAATFEVVLAGDSEVPFICNGPRAELRDEGNPRTSIWGWARDSEACYGADCKIDGADPHTFEALSILYAKDKNRVYYSRKRNPAPVFGADPETFQVSPMRPAEGSDKHHTFFLDKVQK